MQPSKFQRRKRYYPGPRQRATLDLAIKTGILPLDRPAHRLEQAFCDTMRARGQPYAILRVQRGRWRLSLYPHRDLPPFFQWHLAELLRCNCDLYAQRGIFGVEPDMAIAEPLRGHPFKLATSALRLVRVAGGC